MDRKTLLAFALIAVILILTPWYMDLVSPVQKTTAVRDISSNKPQNKPGDSAPVETKAVVRSSPVSSVGTQSFVVSNGLYTATSQTKTVALFPNSFLKNIQNTILPT